jgi:hypothetical protein
MLDMAVLLGVLRLPHRLARTGFQGVRAPPGDAGGAVGAGARQGPGVSAGALPAASIAVRGEGPGDH